MQIFLSIGIAVVMAMVCGPPQHAFLGRRGVHNRHYKLEPTAGLEGTMREIAVIARGYKEHAHVIDREASNQVRPVELNEEGAQAGNMHRQKWQTPQQGYACRIAHHDYTR